MNKYYYDLHIHSCLSPCGDNDMTPNNIAGMAALKGLNLLALTDHNTAKNCPAFFEACRRQGIVPIAGMELTTAEDIHIVCLFETLEAALAFDAFVDGKRVKIKNRTDIFGEQIICNGNDEPLGQEAYLLSNATELPLEAAVESTRAHGAVVYPAHVDRQANGILTTLGGLPPSPVFTAAEFHDGGRIAPLRETHAALAGLETVVCSDAHYLWDINEAEHFLLLDDEPYSSALVRRRALEKLAGRGCGV